MTTPESVSSIDLDVEIPFPVMSNKAEEWLSDKQLFDYRNKQENFAEWLLLRGKKQGKHDGYANTTASNIIDRVDVFNRWVWETEDEYIATPYQDHADTYMKKLAYSDHTNTHKANCQHALKTYFRWRKEEFDHDAWEPEMSFSTGNSNQPRDYLTTAERRKIRQAALEYGDLPYYQNYDPEEREQMKPYIADRVDKSVDSLSRDDWNGLASWKFTSLVWVCLDSGLRPIEVERATTEWVDIDNAVLRIPFDESSKNVDNWTVSLREDTAEALSKWLEERSYRLRYDDTDALWLTQKGNPYKSQSLRRLLLRLCDKAGIVHTNRKMSWYSIRHSVGTFMTREEDLAAAQAQLRHKSPETTMKYDAAPVGDRRDALDKMG